MVKKIAITGGKGGTGKSTVATALAVELSKNNKVLLIDADVDCPNDHLILNIERKKVREIFQPIPKINKNKCNKCGRCSEVCRENAIVQIKGEYPIIISDQCIGCSACMIACPNNAIEKDKKKIGTIYKGNNYGIDFFSAETEIGVEEESPVVNALKKEISRIEEKYDYVLIDTSPGTHCNVISALQGCELAFSVTEPTPLGEHDGELSLKLLKKLKIPFKIILNKSDVGNKKLVEELAKKYKTKIISEIPYKKSILESYSKGEPIKENSIKDIIKNRIK
jgi:MinD superfamily P-loop ATPase